MEDWDNTWKVVFNIDKCEVLQISLTNSAHANYYLYDNPLRIVNEVKYLGVLLDSKLSFNKHIETVCKKANGVLAFSNVIYITVISRLEVKRRSYI